MENLKKEYESCYKIRQFNLETGETINLFKTFQEVKLKTNISNTCGCCQGHVQQIAGFGWEYINRQEKIKFYCEFCGYFFTSQVCCDQHVIKCKEIFPPEKENIDFVRCVICGHPGECIGRHIKQRHNLTSEEYKQQFNKPIQTLNYHNKCVKNGDWITRKKEAGEDLSEYCAKMGKAVSDSIMSNPKERERRSAQLAKNNKTQEARDLAQKTAIKTSSREDILVQRTERLHHSRKPSKAENVLKEILLPLGFLHSQVVKDKTMFITTKTGRRVLDFIHLDKQIIIEFDGGQHFTASFQNQSMELTKLSDDILNDWAINNGYCMIRISYEYFSDRHKIFDQQMLNELFEIINNPQNKLYKLGKAYECQT